MYVRRFFAIGDSLANVVALPVDFAKLAATGHEEVKDMQMQKCGAVQDSERAKIVSYRICIRMRSARISIAEGFQHLILTVGEGGAVGLVELFGIGRASYEESSDTRIIHLEDRERGGATESPSGRLYYVCVCKIGSHHELLALNSTCGVYKDVVRVLRVLRVDGWSDKVPCRGWMDGRTGIDAVYTEQKNICTYALCTMHAELCR